MSVRAGLMTLKEAIARQGYDPAQVLAEIGSTNAEFDALGIVLDTDPRKATKTGAAARQRTPEAASPWRKAPTLAVDRGEQIGRVGVAGGAEVADADADQAERPAVGLAPQQRHGHPEGDIGAMTAARIKGINAVMGSFC